MDDNPYQAPQSAGEPVRAVGVLSGSREDLHLVAKYQKGVLYSLLIEIVLYAAWRFGLSEYGLVSLIPLAIGSLVAMVFVILLATKLYGGVVGTLLGIVTLLPFFGLLVLAAINGKATSVLKQNGIRVGFMGANLTELE